MNNFKHGFKVAINIIIAAMISFFLCISINIICSAAFTSVIGYDAFVYSDETCEELIAEYEYIYTDEDGDGKYDGTDLKKKEYEEQGHFVVTQKKQSELKGMGKAIFLIASQILSLIMIVAFAGSSVYKQGFKDSNLVKIGHKKKDVLRGFKIGLIGNIPFFALFVLAIVTASHFRTVLYAFLNAHYYSLIIWITNQSATLSQISILQYVLLFLLQFIVPIISGVAYVLGLKEINLAEKIVYKRGEI